MVGTFECEVLDHILSESKEKKTPSVKIKLLTDFNVATKESIQQTLYYDAWLTDAAFDKTMEVLRDVLGWTGDNLDDLNGTSKYVGKKAWAVVVEEEYKGKMQSKVSFLNPVGGNAALKGMDPISSASLADKLRGKILNYRQNNPIKEAVQSDGTTPLGDEMPWEEKETTK